MRLGFTPTLRACSVDRGTTRNIWKNFCSNQECYRIRTEGFPSLKKVRNEEVTYQGIIKTLFQMGCMLSLHNLTLQEG